jgi:hypothetical protein
MSAAKGRHPLVGLAALALLGAGGAACGEDGARQRPHDGGLGDTPGPADGAADLAGGSGETCARAALALGTRAAAADALPPFSFFVTSLQAMRELSGSPRGFGGDLRCGETGPGAGLRGADRICALTAERSMPGAAAKGWRAFLSATDGAAPDGGPVHAIDRVGSGPWFDRQGRLVAMRVGDLPFDRPRGADRAIADDLPNEDGVPNHTAGAPGCTGSACPDNHDVLTGTDVTGHLIAADPSATCDDWTSSASAGAPWCGHSWSRVSSGIHWISVRAAPGCAAGVNQNETGGPIGDLFTVGSSGGYGAIYCFALQP